MKKGHDRIEFNAYSWRLLPKHWPIYFGKLGRKSFATPGRKRPGLRFGIGCVVMLILLEHWGRKASRK